MLTMRLGKVLGILRVCLDFKKVPIFGPFYVTISV